MKVIEFIKNNENWRDILSVEPYCLSIKENNNFAILKYSMVDSDFSLDIVKECRGLIIDLNTLEPVALSFYKFFNVQEEFADKINWKKCRVQEKVDGTKILLWYNKYDSKWQLSTSGELDAYAANVSDFGITFGQLFDRAIKHYNNFYDLLDRNFCYTFELVSPESRIVVPYKTTKIYFIGLRYVPTFIECNPDTCEAVAKIVSRPKEYQLNSLSDCLSATNRMGFDEEGFVVVDDTWHRVKIKSPAYVSAHHLRMNGATSIGRVLEIIEHGEQSEFLGYFPEYTEIFEDVENKKSEFFNYLKDAISNVKVQVHNGLDRKALAEYILTQYKDISAFLFKYLDIDLLDMFISLQWNKLQKDKKMGYLGFKSEGQETQEE